MSEHQEKDLLLKIQKLKEENSNLKSENSNLKEINEQLSANQEEMRQLSEVIFHQRQLLEIKSKELEEKSSKIQEAFNILKEKEEELIGLNSELEKLSIVASKTDNAVSIFDSNLNLIWVNEGFTRLFGYNFEEYKEKAGISIFEISSNPKIRSLVAECIENKTSVNYQTENLSSDLRLIWTQTTITPIFDDKNKISKLIAIESDICKLKLAEKEIEKQKTELENKNELLNINNENIKASIRYAQTIQQALLPDMKKIMDFEIGILFKPRDIVSGDFYWHTKISENGIIYNFLAVVDCTGHGVPGAFMSMIGISLLNEIVNEKRIIETEKILHFLNSRIISALNQEYTSNADGMDLCFVRINNKNSESEINYSGAKRPLIYFDSIKKSIEKISGSRKSIGGISYRNNELGYDNHSFILSENSILYLTTDGFIDQNTENRKRIGTPKLLEILNHISKETLTNQFKFLENLISKIMQKEEQRDDITILGIKI